MSLLSKIAGPNINKNPPSPSDSNLSKESKIIIGRSIHDSEEDEKN
jgi:hypothetical protein